MHLYDTTPPRYFFKRLFPYFVELCLNLYLISLNRRLYINSPGTILTFIYLMSMLWFWKITVTKVQNCLKSLTRFQIRAGRISPGFVMKSINCFIVPLLCYMLRSNGIFVIIKTFEFCVNIVNMLLCIV